MCELARKTPVSDRDYHNGGNQLSLLTRAFCFRLCTHSSVHKKWTDCVNLYLSVHSQCVRLISQYQNDGKNELLTLELPITYLSIVVLEHCNNAICCNAACLHEHLLLLFLYHGVKEIHLFLCNTTLHNEIKNLQSSLCYTHGTHII